MHVKTMLADALVVAVQQLAQVGQPPVAVHAGQQLKGGDIQLGRLLQVEGRYVNNVLLYGESGTGKSATVKHLLTLPGMEELRLIEADKADLGGLPALIRRLDGRRQKFIVFIDSTRARVLRSTSARCPS